MPPTKPEDARTREDERESVDTRRRILAAAQIVFARDGFADTTLAEVAREAGLGKSSLYRHVESKAELFVEALLEQAAEPDHYVTPALENDATPEEQLRALATAQRRFSETHPAFRQVVWAIDNQDLIGDLPKPLIARARARWERPLQAIEGILERGIARGDFRPCDPHMTAHIIWNTGNLFFDLRFSHERRRMLGAPLERFHEEALELIIAGLRATP